MSNIGKDFESLLCKLRAVYRYEAQHFEQNISLMDKKAIEELKTFEGEDYIWTPIGEQILAELRRYAAVYKIYD
jgi:hypothetical protein